MKKRKAKTSKFIREYGATLQDLAKKYNTTEYYIFIQHNRGLLHDFIKEQEVKNEMGKNK